MLFCEVRRYAERASSCRGAVSVCVRRVQLCPAAKASYMALSKPRCAFTARLAAGAAAGALQGYAADSLGRRRPKRVAAPSEGGRCGQ